jgi:hypothetical protein
LKSLNDGAIDIPSSSTIGERINHVQNILLARAPKFTHAQILKHNADIAHGVLMGISVILIFPIGAIITRLSTSRRVFWIHVTLQISGLVIFLGGFATGVWTCIIHGEVITNRSFHAPWWS